MVSVNFVGTSEIGTSMIYKIQIHMLSIKLPACRDDKLRLVKGSFLLILISSDSRALIFPRIYAK